MLDLIENAALRVSRRMPRRVTPRVRAYAPVPADSAAAAGVPAARARSAPRVRSYAASVLDRVRIGPVDWQAEFDLLATSAFAEVGR
ncbi:hypothetical protein [Streptomonospora salina]|uniref:hypothetical protein n=1 Tax=Streptomonospora salina TaxID=104205 RepID=UPI00336C40A3